MKSIHHPPVPIPSVDVTLPILKDPVLFDARVSSVREQPS